MRYSLLAVLLGILGILSACCVFKTVDKVEPYVEPEPTVIIPVPAPEPHHHDYKKKQGG